MRELALVEIVNGLIERSQQLQPLRSDAGLHDAAIVFLALARDQGALLHAIEKTRHVGVMGNHTVGNTAAGEAFGLGATYSFNMHPLW